MAAAGAVQIQASTATGHSPVMPATIQRIMAATIERGRMYVSIHDIITLLGQVYLSMPINLRLKRSSISACSKVW